MNGFFVVLQFYLFFWAVSLVSLIHGFWLLLLTSSQRGISALSSSHNFFYLSSSHDSAHKYFLAILLDTIQKFMPRLFCIGALIFYGIGKWLFFIAHARLISVELFEIYYGSWNIWLFFCDLMLRSNCYDRGSF